MVVNDNAGSLDASVVRASIASMLAPTGGCQDFLACSYSGMTFGIAACNAAIRLDDAG